MTEKKDKQDDTTSRSDNSQARRKVMKTLIAGGGVYSAAKIMPDQWARPVVESVVLPGHAQTTEQNEERETLSPLGDFQSGPEVVQLFPGEAVPEALAQTPDSEESQDDVLDYFFPQAKAAPACLYNSTCDVTVSASVRRDPDKMYICLDGEIGGGFEADIDFGFNPPTVFATPMPYGVSPMGGFFTGSGWNVDFWNATSNTASRIFLSPGGPGCSEKMDS